VGAESRPLQHIDAHVANEKISAVERGAEWLLQKVSTIGKQTECRATELVSRRGVWSVRVLLGLLALSQRHSSEEFDQACEIAVSYEAFRLKSVRRLIEKPSGQTRGAGIHRGPSDHPRPVDLRRVGAR